MTQTQVQTSSKSKDSIHSPNFKPLGNRVLVQRLVAEEKLKGILVPETAKKKQEKAKVLAVGTGKTDKSGKLDSGPGSSRRYYSYGKIFWSRHRTG